MTKKLTAYQEELLCLVRAGSPSDKDAPIDFDELLALLSWKPSKASCHFSIRALQRRQMIKKCEALALRRGRKRVCFELDLQGRLYFDPRGDETGSVPAVEMSTSPGDDLLPGLDLDPENGHFGEILEP